MTILLRVLGAVLLAVGAVVLGYGAFLDATFAPDGHQPFGDIAILLFFPGLGLACAGGWLWQIAPAFSRGRG